jgi:hypothetical protein
MFEDLMGIQQAETEEKAEAETKTFSQQRAEYKLAVANNAANQLEDSSNTTLKTINSRHTDALNMRALGNLKVVVIGAGGIGSPAVRELVGMGVKNITVVDYDTVEPQNVGTQFYKVTDIGLTKVEALRDELLERYMVEINIVQAKVNNLTDIVKAVSPAYNEGIKTHIDILIGAVDNMEFRNTVGKEISQGIAEAANIDFYIDARMSLGLWNVYALPLKHMRDISAKSKERRAGKSVTDANAMLTYIFKERYPKDALFSAEEGMNEPCTARALGYTGANVACYIAAMVDYYSRDFRNAEPEKVQKFLDLNTQRDEQVPFKWVAGFSSRSFITTDMNPFLEKQKEKVNLLNNKVATLKEQLKQKQIQTEEQPPINVWHGVTLAVGTQVKMHYIRGEAVVTKSEPSRLDLQSVNTNNVYTFTAGDDIESEIVALLSMPQQPEPINIFNGRELTVGSRVGLESYPHSLLIFVELSEPDLVVLSVKGSGDTFITHKFMSKSEVESQLKIWCWESPGVGENTRLNHFGRRTLPVGAEVVMAHGNKHTRIIESTPDVIRLQVNGEDHISPYSYAHTYTDRRKFLEEVSSIIFPEEEQEVGNDNN